MSRYGVVSPVAVRPALPALRAFPPSRSSALAVLLATLLAVALAVLPLPPAASAATPSLLRDVHHAAQPEISSGIVPLGLLDDGRVVFTADDPRHGREPWVTDGTAAGTRRLGDPCPGPCSGLAESVGMSAGSRVFFLVRQHLPTLERDLWVTDGTVAGTRPLPVRVRETPGPRLQADGAGRVFVLGREVTGADRLWVSDGTEAGTRRLPLPSVPAVVDDREPGLFGGRLGTGRVWFVANTGVGGTQEPWVSDGTPAGTRRLSTGPAVAGPVLRRTTSAYRFAPVGDGRGLMLQVLGPGPGRGQPEDRALALWQTDGTAQGTRRTRVFDRQWLSHTELVAGPVAAFGTASDGLYRLWTSDGTAAGTALAYATGYSVRPGVWSAGRLYFFTHPPDLDGGWELWVHVPDAGSQRLGTFRHGFCSADTRLVPFAGGVAFLAGRRGRQELWTSDGTAAGTGRVAVLGDGDCGSGTSILAGSGAERLFVTVGREERWELLVSDGTAAGTMRLSPAPFIGSGPGGSAAPLAGGLLVSADDGVHGAEPWVSDGTPGGTRLLANLATPVSNGDALPRGLTPRGDERFLFFARDADGWGVWLSDGTGGGTRRLHRLAHGALIDSRPSAYAPRPLRLVGDLWFFAQPVEDRNFDDLKVVDLAAGQLRHLGRFPCFAQDRVTTELNGRLLWAVHGSLVVSDGTLEGTVELPDLQVTDGVPPVPFGTDVLFSGYRPGANGAGSRFGLWRTDGTAEGTRRIFLAADRTTLPHSLGVIGDDRVLFARFRVDEAGRHLEIFRTDGTLAGNSLVATLSEPADSFDLRGPLELTTVGGEALFFVRRPAAERTVLELWSSDGTAAGTRPVVRPRTPGGALGNVSDVRPFAGGLFFVGTDPWYGVEPWVSDGTAAGTRLVRDLPPSEAGLSPRVVVVHGGELFFVAEDAAETLRLWVSDGTAAGTFPIDDAGGPVRPAPAPELVVAGDRVVYTGRSAEQGEELWTLPRTGLTPPPPVPPPSSPPPPPRDLGAGAADDGSVSLSWLPPASHLLAYLVEVRTPAAADFRTVQQESGRSRSSRLDDLPPGVPHTVRVRAVNAAGVSPPSGEVSVTPRVGTVEPCVPDGAHLCLLDGRFRVGVHWRDPRSGDHGAGAAVPVQVSDRAGIFWFFDDANVELIVKVLDGTFVNRRWWVFAGGLTDVEYWVDATDTATGESHTYHQARRDLCGFADTGAFAGEPGESFPLPAAAAAGAAAETPLVLVDGRFRVNVEWRDPRSGDTGAGRPLPWSASTGFLWFFQPQNVELVVKVLDGRPVNGRWWVFFGGLTDVAYTVRVTDVVSGAVRTYEHPSGDLCGGADTSAFPAP